MPEIQAARSKESEIWMAIRQKAFPSVKCLWCKRSANYINYNRQRACGRNGTATGQASAGQMRFNTLTPGLGIGKRG